jgi:hypothetical protein
MGHASGGFNFRLRVFAAFIRTATTEDELANHFLDAHGRLREGDLIAVFHVLFIPARLYSKEFLA